MHSKEPLFCSISGVAAARTKPVYEKLKQTLPAQLPADVRIAFLGCPFFIDGRRKFPLPLLWNAEEQGSHTTTRLLNCWKRLNEFGVTKLRPALLENDIVIVERFGLDAQLYATACCDSDADIDEAERVHHALVKMRVVEQGIKPPLYFIPSADANDVSHLIEAFPALKAKGDDELTDFMAHESRALERYFDPKHGQKKPVLLPISMSVDEMCQRIIGTITAKLEERAAA